MQTGADPDSLQEAGSPGMLRRAQGLAQGGLALWDTEMGMLLDPSPRSALS